MKTRERGPGFGIGHALRCAVAVLLAGTAPALAQRLPESPAGPGTVTASTASTILISDTSSPQATLQSFLRGAELTLTQLRAYIDQPSFAARAVYGQSARAVIELVDLSETPPAGRRRVGAESAMLIWEVLARVDLPPAESIPGTAAFPAAEEGGRPAQWRVPGTEITIRRVATGPYAGEFLFSPDTVAKARMLYERRKDQPYRRPVPVENLWAVTLNGTGWWLPPYWAEHYLPWWSRVCVMDMPLWKWAATILLGGLAILAVRGVFRWGYAHPRDGTFRSYLRRLATPVAVVGAAELLRYVFDEQLFLRGPVATVPGYATEVCLYLAGAWAVWLTASQGAEAIIASPKINPRGLQAHLLRLSARVVGLVGAVVLWLHALNQIGVPVYGLIAGVGVSSLALALAARNSIENFIGSLNLFADSPVRVGEFCRYGTDPSTGWLRIGTVESIGVRSTRIRGIDRTVTTIPNAQFSQMEIVNLTQRDRMLFRPTLDLRRDTTEDQLRVVLARLRGMLLAHPRVTRDPARVRLAGFGEFSLQVEIFAYVNTADWDEFLAIQEDLCLRILRVLEEAGTGFAYPSRTVYLTRQPATDAERQQQARQTVAEWVAANRLPFPEFSKEQRRSYWNTLDYPPTGSPDAADGAKPGESRP